MPTFHRAKLEEAKSVDINLSLKDFQEFSDKTPFIANLKPSGNYLMEDVHKMGGTPVIMKYMLKQSGYCSYF